METMVMGPSPGQEVEVLARPERRRFSVDYKRRILREADRCRKPGEIGALLRREGLYSSQLSVWRAARERGCQSRPIRTARDRTGGPALRGAGRGPPGPLPTPGSGSAPNKHLSNHG